jgi:hypothetical protein
VDGIERPVSGPLGCCDIKASPGVLAYSLLTLKPHLTLNDLTNALTGQAEVGPDILGTTPTLEIT